MAWIGADLENFPFVIWPDDVKESPISDTTVTKFAGKQEQRISYGGPDIYDYQVSVELATEADLDTFRAFYAAHGETTPFKWSFRGTVIYARFDGVYSIGWMPPVRGKVSFNLHEMHPSEIIV